MNNIFRFFGNCNNLNEAKVVNKHLVALTNEVLRFTIPKSEVPCASNVFSLTCRPFDENCMPKSEPEMIKVGSIKKQSSELFGKLYLVVEDLVVGQSLRITTAESEDLIDTLIEANQTLDDFANSLKAQANVFDTKIRGQEIEMLVDSKFCNKELFVSNYDKAYLSSSKVSCCCSDSFEVEIRVPSEVGCYNFFLAKCNDPTNEAYAISPPVAVTNDDAGTVLFEFVTKDGDTYRLRLKGSVTSIQPLITTEQEELANGSTVTKSTIISDQRIVSLKENDTQIMAEFEKLVYNSDRVYINGVLSNISNRAVGDVTVGKYGVNYTVTSNTVKNSDCGDSCQTTEYGTLEVDAISDRFGDTELYIKSDANWQKLEDLNQLEPGDYRIKITNIKKDTTFVLSKNGTLIKEVDAICGSSCSFEIRVKPCEKYFLSY